MTSCRAGARLAMTSGPCWMMLSNRLAVLRAVADNMGKRKAETAGGAAAAPTQREKLTHAAPGANRPGAEKARTGTFNTPQTQPQNKAITQTAQASCAGVRCGAKKAIMTSPTVAAVKP